MSAVKAVEKDLKRLRERDKELAESTLAATALAMAHELDGANSATSKSMCARVLNETMERLWELAPAEKENDGVDELTARRDARRSAA